MLMGSGNLDSKSNFSKYRDDAVMSGQSSRSASHFRYEIPARVSAANENNDFVRSSQQPYTRHRWNRGPSRDYPNTDDHRHWTYNKAPLPPSAGRFVVVSFNILGVDNANQHLQELYWHIPPFVMDWNYRKRKILLELGLWSADIICLQEVDRFEDLQNDLVRQGYEGIHKGRTGESSDGCATFWRSKKFVLLQEESIEYQELNLRHNVAQLCVLRIAEEVENRAKAKRPKGVDDNLVVVCNIHVLFNPKRGDIKLGQVRHLLEKAHSLSQAWGGIPVVVAGDFNSVPQSPLYQYLFHGMLNVTEFDRREVSGQLDKSHEARHTRTDSWISTSSFQVEAEGQSVRMDACVCCSDERLTTGPSLPGFKWTPEELENATGIASTSILKHDLELQSAYSFVQGSSETRDKINEPLVTTYHGNFMGTVDYIWFSKGLTPVRVLELLPTRILRRVKGLPSKKWGSDHLALACEFAFDLMDAD